MAFVPQFLSPTGAFLPQVTITVATFVTKATLNAALYGLLASSARGALRKPSVQRAVNRTGGGLLAASGVTAALWRRSPARLVWVETVPGTSASLRNAPKRRRSSQVNRQLARRADLLGHTRIKSTARFFGVDVEDVLALAEGTKI